MIIEASKYKTKVRMKKYFDTAYGESLWHLYMERNNHWIGAETRNYELLCLLQNLYLTIDWETENTKECK